MTNETLDSLVRSGDIVSYKEEQISDQYDSMSLKTTEKVEITFPSGRTLVIHSSNALKEDTYLQFGTLE